MPICTLLNLYISHRFTAQPCNWHDLPGAVPECGQRGKIPHARSLYLFKTAEFSVWSVECTAETAGAQTEENDSLGPGEHRR